MAGEIGREVRIGAIAAEAADHGMKGTTPTFSTSSAEYTLLQKAAALGGDPNATNLAEFDLYTKDFSDAQRASQTYKNVRAQIKLRAPDAKLPFRRICLGGDLKPQGENLKLSGGDVLEMPNVLTIALGHDSDSVLRLSIGELDKRLSANTASSEADKNAFMKAFGLTRNESGRWQTSLQDCN